MGEDRMITKIHLVDLHPTRCKQALHHAHRVGGITQVLAHRYRKDHIELLSEPLGCDVLDALARH